MGISVPVIGAPLLGSVEAWREILRTQPDHLLALWRLNETAGTAVADSSGNGRSGTATGVTWVPAGPNGARAASFDGVNDLVNVYSAGLAGAFNGDEGSLLLWCRAANADVWADGSFRRLVYFGADADNEIFCDKTNSGSVRLYREGDGTADYASTDGAALGTAWHCLAMTWSATADENRYYLDGALLDTDTGLGSWDGALSNTLTTLGAYTTTPAMVWHGDLALVALWDTPLTGGEMAALGGA